MKNKILPTLILLIVATFLFVFRNKLVPQVGQNSVTQLNITTSFYPLYYFTSQIAGDSAQVTNITPSGAEPHDYELMPQDLVNIGNSQLLVLNGQLEPWASKVKSELAGKSTKIIEVSNGLINQQLQNENGELAADPHVWLSPKLASQMVQTITDELITLDPSNQAQLASRSSELQAKLASLDQDYASGLANCQSRDIVTSHAAFGYLAKDYNLNQVALSGLSPDSEPSLKDLTSITQFARDHQVKYIFFESLVSPKLSETVAKEIGAKTLVLNPLEGLSVAEIAAGKDYFSIMQDNLANLRTALKCQ